MVIKVQVGEEYLLGCCRFVQLVGTTLPENRQLFLVRNLDRRRIFWMDLVRPTLRHQTDSCLVGAQSARIHVFKRRC